MDQPGISVIRTARVSRMVPQHHTLPMHPRPLLLVQPHQLLILWHCPQG